MNKIYPYFRLTPTLSFSQWDADL